MEYLLVGFGGIFGSIARYSLGKIISKSSSGGFPVGTFIINISGALLMGIITVLPHSKNTFLLLGDGFLGAYTTFSTFMYEGFNLYKDKKRKNMIVYIVSSVMLGVIGFAVGSGIVGIIVK